jgi:class 3 adenylate cyclase
MSSLKRRLAAIVFTDIVGFTDLSSKDEEGAYKLVVKQREILKPIVEKHEGEWLKEEGDGLLLSFPSSKQAVNCSIQMQAAVKNIEDLNLRIGIHQGDIIIEDKDVFGDDVNIASRIEPFAVAGGIAVSQKIQQDLSSNPEFKFKFIDTPKLKGVQQEVSIYCIISHGLPESKKSDIQAKVEPQRKYYKEILISTLFGIILFSYLPQFFQSGDFNFFQSSFSRSANIKNPVTGDLISTKHSKNILTDLFLVDSLLTINTLSDNLEAITISELLINEDSTQGDFYSLKGLAYFQRATLQDNSKGILEISMQELSRSIGYNNINIDYLAKAYMAISDIYLLNGEIKNADKNIKIALRANRRIKGGMERMKKINKIKLQSLENLK